MKFNVHAVAAIIVAFSFAGSASAQTAGSNPQTSNTNATMAMGTPADTTVNPGTLAESADTTALATSTYHQDNGLFSWFDHGR